MSPRVKIVIDNALIDSTIRYRDDVDERVRCHDGYAMSARRVLLLSDERRLKSATAMRVMMIRHIC